MRALALALVLGVAACGPRGEPAANWDGFRDGAIAGWFELDPAFAVYQGKHEFDGRMPDWSATGLKTRATFLHNLVDRAKRFTSLKGDAAFERDYLIDVAQGQLFWLEDADDPHHNPTFYGSGLDPNVYLARNYAAPEVRMKALIAMFKAVPAAAANIRANLKTPMPASFVKRGIGMFGGYADFYAKDAVTAFAEVKDAALQQELETSAADAGKAMAELADWLKGEATHATQDFALGPEKFSRMLLATEHVDTPLDQLDAVGRADLKRNRDALIAECARFDPGASVPDCMAKFNKLKPPEGQVAAARHQIPELRQFVVSHDLVSIPGTEEALVREAPPFNRGNGAYIDPPGPFDKGIPSVYYISPPDPEWSKADQYAYLSPEPDLLFTTVHEVMPGHFLQFLHSNRAPSMFGRLFVGYAFAEGWAHYSEELMWEAGLRAGDSATHIGELSNALLRDCRFVSAIGLHARGMTQAQSKQLFEDQCFQDPGNAEQQAARGTYDPAYLNYTMGKLMIRKLREDWTAKHGGRASWKAFHDKFLSFGGPPIPLVRQAMMGEPEAKAVF